MAKGFRPVIVAIVAVAIFVKSPQTSGRGLALELVGLAVGLALGALGSLLLMTIRRDSTTNKLISIAGAGYAAFWIIVIGARLLFTYGANHWYNHALGSWLFTNRITVDGLTDGLICSRLAWSLPASSASRASSARTLEPGRLVPASAGEPDPARGRRAARGARCACGFPT